jgi:hypothetical protein
MNYISRAFLSILLLALAAPVAAYLDMGPPSHYYSEHDHFPAATDTVGGPGGAGLYQECKNFQGKFAFLRGLEVNSGNWIDAVGIECGNIEQDQGRLRFTSPATDMPLAADRMWGGNGGSPAIMRCPSDREAVAGLRIQKSPNNFVGFVAPLCRPLDDPNAEPHMYEESGGVGRISDKSPPWQDIVCPPGMLATGINGGYGDYVDRLGLVCLPAPLAVHETLGAGMDDNTNRAWSDYTHFTVPRNGAARCQSACNEQRGKCRAWAYVREGVQGSEPICYLKDSAPAPVHDTCCISGTVADPVISSVKETSSASRYSHVSPTPDMAKYVRPTEKLEPAGPVVGEPGGFAGPAPTMTGVFDTDFGQLMLTSSDGMYSQKNGHVKITKIYGDFMDGTWTQSEASQQCSDGSYRGTFHFRFTKDGFTGTYGYCDGPANAGPWNGTRR